HAELLDTARRIATAIVGNNQKAVRSLLASYHQIDDLQNGAALWHEAAAAREWMKSASGDDIAESRSAVIERGRSQVR
ncbi:enoyl-CoA hydratase, partial [Mycobacterium sp. ITM-2017-0098]